MAYYNVYLYARQVLTGLTSFACLFAFSQCKDHVRVTWISSTASIRAFARAIARALR